MKTISIEQFKESLLNRTPVIDVRAAVEFKTGAIPGSINIPVLDDQERHDVGTCYKVKGQEAAIALGHKLVSGENLQRKIAAWKSVLDKNPEAIITCFRGGLRSQSTQKFLQTVGVETTRLEKGYKSARAFFIDHLQAFSAMTPMLILSGTTGSGKTHVLHELAGLYPSIDLEGLAHHRGSAFGAWSIAQPAQADFENRLAVATLQISTHKPLLIEDESRLIGSCHVPEYFFTKMRQAPVVLIEESVQQRVENIFIDYISSLIHAETSPEKALEVFAKYETSIHKIQKKLGGLRAQELLADMQLAKQDFLDHRALQKHKIWIEKLLVWYYDSMYLSSLQQRQPAIAFKGTKEDVKAYLLSHS